MSKEKIFNIISKTLSINIKNIDINTNSDNTKQWDSLATTNIIVALEEGFDIDIDLDDAEKFVSVEAIIKIIEGTYI